MRISFRFDALGAMHSGASWIELYCDNIEANLATAEKQDRELHSLEVEDVIETR